ncbi:acyltransferase family protein [Parafilimonas sp.]|uniref:acyltransferase family protein n=1 Tax=Parafilimonas sp. TaxID=1969739 RepID=UPI0039E4FE24
MASTTVTQEKKRLLSLDFFRGLTIAAMILVNNPGDWSYVYAPLEHSKWNGCTPTDLIFPFFLFMVGVSIVYAMSSKKADKNLHKQTILKALWRSVKIYLIYVAIHFLFVFNFHHFRILGVLPRIAIIFFICTIIYLKTNFKTWLWLFAVILILYCFLMTVVPVPGYGYAILEPGKNLAAWLDNIILTPEHMWSGTKTWDPEGILSTLPAICTCLYGIMVGATLKRTDKTEAEQVAWLLTFALFSIMLALIWNNWFPINKSLWTSSFVLYTGGLATAGLAVSYWLIDVHQRKKYITPFVAYGANAITAYVSADVVLAVLGWIHLDLHGKTVNLQEYLYQTIFVPNFSPINASLAGAVTYVLILMAPMLILYKKKIFLKV